ncbi:MAG: sarcosine oxidase subunit gamma [Rhodobacter sp.]|nr:sarcosine oxidase subunit gamma [Rhodobacter sp.]MBK8441764.1 sarcosine oxidase subunit gamma [Rhodobacter sp.]
MADTLHALTALGHAAPETVEIGPYRITERFDVALASIASRKGRDKDVEKAAKAENLPLPGPAAAAEGATWASFWVAPQMWIVEAPFASHEDIVSHLKPAFGDAASITEQTDAWVRFDLAAPDLVPLMERLCNVDFSKAAAGFASRVVVEHTSCYLIKRGQGEVTLYGPRSSARSLLHALETAATSLL